MRKHFYTQHDLMCVSSDCLSVPPANVDHFGTLCIKYIYYEWSAVKCCKYPHICSVHVMTIFCTRAQQQQQLTTTTNNTRTVSRTNVAWAKASWWWMSIKWCVYWSNSCCRRLYKRTKHLLWSIQLTLEFLRL